MKRPTFLLWKGDPDNCDPLELAYAIMREAEACQPVSVCKSEDGKFLAMAWHTWLYDLGMEYPRVGRALIDYGFNARVGENQTRLGIW